MPEGRHSHGAVKSGDDVLVIGGLGLNSAHINTCLRIYYDEDGGGWSMNNFHLPSPIATRYICVK